MSSPYTGDDPYVYISYVREDHPLVIDDIDRLADLGIRCYWDPGNETDEDRLKGAAFFVAMVSDGAEDSEALVHEIGLALRESKDAACIHLADVPLGGKAELLLKGVTDVKKYRMSESLYLRWLVNGLPDGVKTREIVIPKEEPRPAPAKAKAKSKARTGGGGAAGPSVVERLKEVDPKLWAVVGGFCLLFLVGLIAMSWDGGGAPETETADKTASKTADVPSDPEAEAKARAEARAKEAAHQKELEARQRREEAKWTLRQNLDKGQQKFADEDWDGAIQALTAGIDQPDLARGKLESDLAKAYLLRARAHAKKRERAPAVKDYREYVKLQPDDGDGWYEMGLLLYQLRKFKEAVAAFDHVVKLQPDRALGWRYRGDAHRRLKQYQEALADYSKNIEVDPKDAAAYRYRARVKRALGDEQGASDDMAKSSELLGR